MSKMKTTITEYETNDKREQKRPDVQPEEIKSEVPSKSEKVAQKAETESETQPGKKPTSSTAEEGSMKWCIFIFLIQTFCVTKIV